jgi:mono/diheme cytochrome c family protein
MLAPAVLAQRSGGFVPGQKRPPGDPVEIARGKQVYGISCRSCHGADLRGGDMGGPNLLRSQLALADRAGELIVPVIQGSLARSGMPAIPMSPEDAKAAREAAVAEADAAKAKLPSLSERLKETNLRAEVARAQAGAKARKRGSCGKQRGAWRQCSATFVVHRILRNF